MASKGKAQDLFRGKAPTIMANLMADIPAWGVEDAAACLGNLGHECAGFTLLQEQKPTVKGSKGGYGWAQWTGPRRRAYEAFAKANALDPAGDDANYRFLIAELRGIESAAVPKTAKAKGLDAKVVAFEKGFERAGVKHYPSRQQWARIALDAFEKSAYAAKGKPASAPQPAEAPKPAPTPQPAPAPSPVPKPSVPLPGKPEAADKRADRGLFAMLLALLGGGGAALTQGEIDSLLAWAIGGVVALAIVVVVVLLVRSKR